MQEKLNEYLTVKELSKWLKLSTSHIYHLVNQQGIPHAKLGGKLLFDADKIRKWIEDSTSETIDKKQKRKKTKTKSTEVNNLQDNLTEEDIVNSPLD